MKYANFKRLEAIKQLKFDRYDDFYAFSSHLNAIVRSCEKSDKLLDCEGFLDDLGEVISSLLKVDEDCGCGCNGDCK